MKKITNKSVLPMLAGAGLILALPFFSSSAYAGCDPKCKSGETCRYEAAGGKYYCEVSKSVRKGSLKQALRYESANPGSNNGDLLR